MAEVEANDTLTNRHEADAATLADMQTAMQFLYQSSAALRGLVNEVATEIRTNLQAMDDAARGERRDAAVAPMQPTPAVEY